MDQGIIEGLGQFEDVGGQEQFKIAAGKMYWDGKKCVADKRQGYLTLVDSFDSLLHLRWRDRENQVPEDDLIIIKDAFLAPIKNEIATKHRCFALHFISNDSKMVFWFQDSDATKDLENVKKFNSVTDCPLPEGLTI